MKILDIIFQLLFRPTVFINQKIKEWHKEN